VPAVVFPEGRCFRKGAMYHDSVNQRELIPDFAISLNNKIGILLMAHIGTAAAANKLIDLEWMVQYTLI